VISLVPRHVEGERVSKGKVKMMRGARLLGGWLLLVLGGRGKNNFRELICGQPNRLQVCVSGLKVSLW
jgi:hypothetical protein